MTEYWRKSVVDRKSANEHDAAIQSFDQIMDAIDEDRPKLDVKAEQDHLEELDDLLRRKNSSVTLVHGKTNGVSLT